MNKSSVMLTRELNLCVSCEICAISCPKNCIKMEYKLGQFLPRVDSSECVKCGICLNLCPGIDVDPLNFRSQTTITEEMLGGEYIESYTAYANDLNIRQICTSGGLITTLIVELIKKKDFDGAFVLKFDYFKEEPARVMLTNQIKEILNSSKSKYIPASVYNVIMELKKQNSAKYIIVGTPCQISGIKKYIKYEKITEDNLLFLGLFCDKTLNLNIIRYFEEQYRNSDETITKLEFRTKEKYGWPGNLKLYFNNDKELFVDRNERMRLKSFFQLNRCLFCYDKLNMLADISVGDCYIKGKEEFNGKSSVIVRTEKGSEILEKYSYLFDLEKEKMEEIRKSQHTIDKIENVEYIQILLGRNNMNSETIKMSNKNNKTEKRLSRLQKHIKWGMQYNKKLIKSYLFLSKIISSSKKIFRTIIPVIILVFTILKDISSSLFRKKARNVRSASKRNVIIIGGELFNKGAQAMTFTTVDQIKRRFPNSKIYLFSTQDFLRGSDEKNVYNFEILPWSLGIKLELIKFFGIPFNENNTLKYVDKVIDVIKNTEFIVDISGYALTSQFGFRHSLNYLVNIIVAKKYSIPFYIFPQSIGPFDYSLKSKTILYLLMKTYLPYPKKIYVREEEGLKYICRFSKENVRISKDIVLLNKEYDLSNIYNRKIISRNIKIEPNSIGIIPNSRVIERTDPTKIYSVYSMLINNLIKNEKSVYLLRHSYEDLQVCQNIKKLYPDNECVKLISDDFSAFELENILKQFDFVIASRFHSIVHSYKYGVPALVIGWATKYFELLKEFDQLDYFFDVRNDINVNEMINKLEKMAHNHEYEKEKIIQILNKANMKNIFDDMHE